MATAPGKAPDISGAMVTDPVPTADWLLVAPVAIPLVFGAVLLMFRHETRWQASVAIAGLALCLVATAALFARVLSDGPLAMTMGRWLPPFGISFNADLLGASFTLVAMAVALVCSVFSVRDIGTTGRRYGFYSFLHLMMAGVNGAFLTGDVFNLYVWFEVFLISSFGLLVLGSERQQIDGAMKYAVLNLVGTTLFLIGTGYLYGIFGTLSMADIAGRIDEARGTAPLMTLAVLYLLAFGMKAAAFPVNFWLPASYHTPRIVTAALFGGVLTKIGVYAILRILVMIMPPEREALAGLIAWVAGATMIVGILGALAQSDIRRILGFVVISGVGVMLAGVAIGTPLGLAGTVLYAFHSMLVMTALYLLGGVIKEVGGSYSLHEVAGLYARFPLLAALALILVLAAAGLPPASGLWPKAILVKAAVDTGAPWLAFAILASGLLTTIALGRVFTLVFWRPRPAGGEDQAARPETATPVMGYALLATLSVPILLLGLYPEPAIAIAMMAGEGVLSPAAYIEAVFPGGGRP